MGSPLTVYGPHSDEMLLNSHHTQYLSAPRLANYITSSFCFHPTYRLTQLSPATLLPLPEDNIPHDCIVFTGQLLTPLLYRQVHFQGRPGMVHRWMLFKGTQWKLPSGYAINKIIEPSLLPEAKPAQQAELHPHTDRRTQELKSLALAIVDRFK